MYNLRKKNNNYDDFYSDMFVPFERMFMPMVGDDFPELKEIRSPGIPANVKEVKDGYEVELAIPGYDKGDIKAEMVDTKHLKVEINRDKEVIDKKEHREFYRHEHLSRIVPLDKDVDASKINAEYKDGVLKLSLPFNTKIDNSRLIEIK